jgi:uncharacterized Zn-binding protein involved in type VI secretion
MPNAARIIDMHVCPLVSGSPHVGGVIGPPGTPSILINGQPAVKAGDKCVCTGPNAVAKGSMTVMFENKPAARLGDLTSHGGTIMSGSANVIIGG